MWYEILPSAALVLGFLYIPSWISFGNNYFFKNGKSSIRHWDEDPRDFMSYMRDQRLNGSEYIPTGLEGIPDEK